jgi:hypothetical protein
MYGLYSRAASNQERLMMARVQFTNKVVIYILPDILSKRQGKLKKKMNVNRTFDSVIEGKASISKLI